MSAMVLGGDLMGVLSAIPARLSNVSARGETRSIVVRVAQWMMREVREEE